MFSVPALTYDYDALSDYISADIMELHHDKHHQAYVDKLNAAIEKYPELQSKSVEGLLVELNTLPEDIRTTVRNNGGGHYNHCLFWLWMSPQGGGQPSGLLLDAILQRYETFENFEKNLQRKRQDFLEVVGFGFSQIWILLQRQTRIRY